MKGVKSLSGNIFFALAILFCLAVLIPAPSSGEGTSTVVRKSGVHGLNVHTKLKGDYWHEIVRGQITYVRSDGIMMDGEFFSFAGARLMDEYDAPLVYTDIYPGLSADVIYVSGRIEKIVIRDLRRPMTVTDPKVIEKERAKALRGR